MATVMPMHTDITTTPIRMTTEPPALLPLLWLASPALPVGGFSYSEGLEAAVEAGLVHDEASTASWLDDQLHLGQARSDLAVVAQAVPAWRAADHARLQALNTWVLHTRETHELRLQTEQMGHSMLAWARSLGPAGATLIDALDAAHLAPPTWPLAWSAAAAHSGAPVRDCVTTLAFAWAENQVQAALKAVPLGQGAGQRTLARLVAAIPAAVDTALSLRDDQRQSFLPSLAILSARHETQYSRLFRS